MCLLFEQMPASVDLSNNGCMSGAVNWLQLEAPLLVSGFVGRDYIALILVE